MSDDPLDHPDSWHLEIRDSLLWSAKVLRHASEELLGGRASEELVASAIALADAWRENAGAWLVRLDHETCDVYQGTVELDTEETTEPVRECE